MPDKIAIELENVQKTLLLPLWGRAKETQKKKPLLVDPTAVEIIRKIDFDFSTIEANMNPISQFAWVARSLQIDHAIRGFLSKYPQATIVNIGCGMDTTFDRVDNGSINWYDLDLPDVITLRKKFIAENERRKFLASSLLEDQWLTELQDRVCARRPWTPVFFMAAGVLYYFEAEQMKLFFRKLAERFPGSELIFDAATPLGVKVSNQKVITEGGGMNESSFLKWGLESINELASWDPRIQITTKYPMFKKMKRTLPWKLKYWTFMSDRLNIMYMVQVKFRG